MGLRRLWLLGLSHRSTPVAVRERLSLADGEAGAVARQILDQVAGLEECAALSTCNRLEVVACGDPTRVALAAIPPILAAGRGVLPEAFADHLYVHEDRAAARHLFRVASSLDSMVVGEPQILGQVKGFYEAAVEAGTTGAMLHRLFHNSFSVAKRVRSETAIAVGSVSLASVAAELARTQLGSLAAKTALVIGAGRMAEAAARHLREHGVGRLVCVNRNFARASALAHELGTEAATLDELPHHLDAADVVVGSSAARDCVLRASDVERMLRARTASPLLLIDLGVPRNFDPLLRHVPGAALYDIDDLEGVIRHRRDQRGREAARASAIVEHEADEYWRWFRSLGAAPTIVALRGRAAGICRREVERTLGSLRHLADGDRRVIEGMAEAIVNKLLHEPICRLKRAVSSDAEELRVARRLFGLDEAIEEDRS